MIDEMAEVRAYLAGKKPTQKTQYRCAYLLARYFAAEGLDERDATRAILKWGQSVGHWFTIQVSEPVYYAIHKPRPLRGDIVVYINEDDIDEIKRRYAKPKVRTLALGLVAYAKAIANEDGVFDISVVGLSDWLGLNRSSVNRWLDMMEEDGFLSRHFQKKRPKKIRTPSTRMKLNIPLRPDGEYEIRDNAVTELAALLF